MQIAPDFEADKWEKLDLDNPESPDWNVAIHVFKSRIEERYIAPTDCLVDAETVIPATDRRFGFAITAIDCLLIETLGAFIEGLEDTKNKSKEIFCNYLTSREGFKKDFTRPLAEQFYKEFRCGVLHQAEVKGSSKVWSIGPLVWMNGDSMVVNRNEFHMRLKSEFEEYLQELENPANMELRSNFRKKMGFIARL